MQHSQIILVILPYNYGLPNGKAIMDDVSYDRIWREYRFSFPKHIEGLERGAMGRTGTYRATRFE